HFFARRIFPQPPPHPPNHQNQRRRERHNILLRRRAEGDQVHRHGGQRRVHGAVQSRERGHHIRHHESHQQHHQHDQHRGQNQRNLDLLLHRQRKLLIRDVAVHHLRQAAALFPGHYGSDEDLGKDSLLPEG